MRILNIIIVFTIFSCSNIEPRYAINHIKHSNNNTPFILKNIIEEQDQIVNNYLTNYPDYNYINSKKGFWYYFNEEKKINDKKANFGDLIEFNYSVKGLDNNIIYDIQTVGDQSYMMDKQQIFTGLNDALKILKTGEIGTFIFPSYKAYGIYGDLNKIPPNTAIICTIKVNSINSIKN